MANNKQPTGGELNIILDQMVKTGKEVVNYARRCTDAEVKIEQDKTDKQNKQI